MTILRATNEEIIEAYRRTGSVWRAGKDLGLCGQSVWERLRALGRQLDHPRWTAEEVAELESLAGQCTIGEIARRLGRSYAAVADQISRRGLGRRYGNRLQRKLPRGAGLDRRTTLRHARALAAYTGSLKRFCRSRGLDIELTVKALQRHAPEFWARYTASRSDLGAQTCGYCGTTFYPLSKKQRNCTRRCSSLQRQDERYFGGKRRTALGMAEGRCQLCGRANPRGLSAHHVLGKEHDPDDAVLIALCPGCHRAVGLLATRRIFEAEAGWEDLIALVLARRFGGDRAHAGVHVAVDIERLSAGEIDELAGELA